MGRVVWTDRRLFNKLQEAPAKIDSAIFALTESYRPRFESYARSNAPWQDQTGNARGGLTARTEHTPQLHAIDLFHRMPYGIYLETRWNGRYEIIMPTIRNMGRQMMTDARTIMRRI